MCYSGNWVKPIQNLEVKLLAVESVEKKSTKGGLTFVVLEPALSGFETKNWLALWEAPSSSIFAARQTSLYN